MEIVFQEASETKLCHAKAGDVVRLLLDNGSLDKTFYLVAIDEGKKKENRTDLYAYEGMVRLIRLVDCRAVIVNLSVKCKVYPNACIAIEE